MATETAFVFPGQGSQSVGMLRELAATHPEVEQTFRQAADALGFDLWDLVREGPEQELNRTERTQPAMLAAGVAVWRVWRATGGPVPGLMAGHSLGEYTALVCAGSLDFDDAVALVADRGRFMQEAVPEGEGALAAVLGLDAERLGELCSAETDGVVEPANYNAPGQLVIGGDAAAVDRVLERAKAAGAKRALRLPVSVPAHTRLMRPASERLAERLQQVTLRPTSVPVIHNVDLSRAADAEAIRERLVRQVSNPVRWVETVRFFAAAGAQRVVECGPGRVLAGLGRRIDRSLPHAALDTPGALDALLEDNDEE